MIVTTTPTIEGYEIVEYLGIIAGEAVSGINMFKDLGAGIRNVFGGRSAGYEEEMQNARREVLDELADRAEQLGANAVVGTSLGYETFEGGFLPRFHRSDQIGQSEIGIRSYDKIYTQRLFGRSERIHPWPG